MLIIPRRTISGAGLLRRSREQVASSQAVLEYPVQNICSHRTSKGTIGRERSFGRRDRVTNASYRWVIVAAGGLMGCVAIGAMFSLPVFLVPISRDTGWSATGVSGAMTIGFLAMALASMAWGTLSDRLGPRRVVLIGSVVLAASLALASRATSLVQFQLTFGLLVGGAAAAIFAPMMACVTGWFDTRRGLAVSLVSAGIGVAPMTMSPFAAWLVSLYD
jgi:MFS family permease